MLVIVVTNDLGSALLNFGIFLAMLYVATGRALYVAGGLALFLLGTIGIGGSIVTWFGIRTPQIPAVTVYTPPADSGQVPPAA